MRANKIRNPRTFERNEPLVHTRYGQFFDKDIKPGDVINVGEADGSSTISMQTAMRLWMARKADYQSEWQARQPVEEPETEPLDYAAMVEIEHRGGAFFNVTAPWLPEPLMMKGRPAAEAKMAEVQAEGPPEGWEPAE